MIAEGKQSKEIAEALCAAVKRVDHHRQNLMNKLGLHDVASLTKFAIRAKLLSA
jgi:DNA-binding NarL/FixJ family response regulator